jgi:site-specific recombinase XerD
VISWQGAIETTDPFGPFSAARSWYERTLAKTAKGYGRWLGWAIQNGIDMDQHPADRVSEQNLKNYVGDLRSANSDYTVLCRLQELCNAMRVMAPDRDWSWLRRAQNSLRSRCVPVRDKASRMQSVGTLVQLGKTLMRAAETSGKPPLSRAVVYRDGLMIALLAYRPLRLSNLAMIRLDRHLIRHTVGYYLFLSASETKGKQPFETMVPDALIADFDRYLDHYRPILLTRGSRQEPLDTDHLWIADTATPLDPKSIPQRIKKHTRAAFGKHIWPHLFRDCAATSIAVEDPRNARSIKTILGHSSLTTSEKHYNQARSLEASRRYQRVIVDLLEQADDGGGDD